MSTNQNPDLHAFHAYVGDILATGRTPVSPEQALGEWRLSHRSEAEIADDLTAIREALMDLENGDEGIPLANFDRDFRARHGLPSQP